METVPRTARIEIESLGRSNYKSLSVSTAMLEMLNISLFVITVKTLTMRRKRAADLKMQTDKAPSMNEQELAELRADIKVRNSLEYGTHWVSARDPSGLKCFRMILLLFTLIDPIDEIEILVSLMF